MCGCFHLQLGQSLHLQQGMLPTAHTPVRVMSLAVAAQSARKRCSLKTGLQIVARHLYVQAAARLLERWCHQR